MSVTLFHTEVLEGAVETDRAAGLQGLLGWGEPPHPFPAEGELACSQMCCLATS